MTTKEKLIDILRQFYLNEIKTYNEAAELIISKLPEWGWSYDDLNDPDSEITQVAKEIGEMSDEEFMKLDEEFMKLHENCCIEKDDCAGYGVLGERACIACNKRKNKWKRGDVSMF